MALPDRIIEAWLAASCGAALTLVPLLAGERLALAAVAALFLAFALHFLYHIRDIADAARETAFAMLGFLYIPFMLMHLVWLRQSEYGVAWLFLCMLIVMTNDTAAYYIGSAFGRHRLYPLVSPKKSIEGSLGGLAGGIGGALLARFTFFPQLTLTDTLLSALLIGILGQAGDLFESMLKRSFGVKDSGTILPGHGGVLDRMDSILFAAPAAYYYAVYVFGRF